jgi:aspartate/methionine/tyrosine aminotransferase
VALAGCINPGDEVLIITPCFYFQGAVKLLGGICRFVNLNPANGFKMDIPRIEKNITSKTRALIWNTPVNPSGYVATESDTKAVAALAEKYDFTIIADESFEKWVFDGQRHISLGSLPEVRERVITLHSFSKTYSMARWRVGYLAAPGMDLDSLQKIMEHVLLECNSVSQIAATAALTGPQDWIQHLTEKILNQRQIICEGLQSIDEISFPVPQGGPNVFVNISRIAESDVQFSDYILEKYGLPMVPGEALRCPGHVRFCFAGDEGQLREAIERFRTAVNKFPD